MTQALPVPPMPQLPSPRVSRYVENATAVNTRKAYRIDWDDFSAWCELHDRRPMPASTETIADYLEALADAGAALATIKRRLASLSVAHQLRGLEDILNPTKSAPVRTAMKGIRRTLGSAQTQKVPLVTADLARLVAACAPLPPLTAARDRSLLLLGGAGGFRRSELAALDIADLTDTHEGLEITVRRSKTDQEGVGALVAVPYGSHPHTCPVRALREWLSLSAITEGPLWRAIDRHGNLNDGRLESGSIARIIKRACDRAGLDPSRYAGHSLRAGMATAASEGGASDRSIMNQGRWRSRATVDRYVRRRTIWQENAAAHMGL